MKLRASAPGKVVLLGEYAVLYGAPALVMAVDRRATVEIEASPRRGVEIVAPDVHPHPVHLELEADGALRWIAGEEAAPAFSLVTGLLRGLVSTGILRGDALACRLRLDTSPFFWHGAGKTEKLGLGSSAALTVALASALVLHAGNAALLADNSAWLRQLLALHRDFQGGRGSGLDVAASLYGGVIRYELRAGDEPRAEPLRWPPQLVPLMVWSGRSASTGRFLADLEGWRMQQPQAAAEIFTALTKTALAAAAAASAGEIAQLMDLAAEYAVFLQRLGEAAKISIFTAEHQAIGAAVTAEGTADEIAAAAVPSGLGKLSRAATYKPCGAGGGDLGMALAANGSIAALLRRRLSDAGFSLVDLKEDPVGLRFETF